MASRVPPDTTVNRQYALYKVSLSSGESGGGPSRITRNPPGSVTFTGRAAELFRTRISEGMSGEVARLQTAASKATAEKQAIDGHIAKAKTELAALDQRRTAAVADIDAANEQLVRLNDRIAAATKTVQQLEDRIGRLRADLAREASSH